MSWTYLGWQQSCRTGITGSHRSGLQRSSARVFSLGINPTDTPQAPLTPARFGERQLEASEVPRFTRSSENAPHTSTLQHREVQRSEEKERKQGCPVLSGSQKQLLGAWSRPQPPSATHGVVVLGNHRRVHEVALTPIHLGTLVGKYARHRRAPWGKERSRSVVCTGRGRLHTQRGPRSSCVWHQPAQHSLTRLPRTHPLPNTHPNAELFLSPLGAGAANRPRKRSWTLRVVTKPWH